MFGDGPNFGFMPTTVIDLRAGNLYNVAISLLIFLGCAYTAWNIFSKGKKSAAENSFSLFLLALGVHWLTVAIGNFLAWLNLFSRIGGIAYLVKSLSVLPLVFLAYYLCNEAFESRTSVRRATFLYVLVSLLYLAATFRQDLTQSAATYWGVQWQVGALPLSIFLWGMLFPLGIISVYLIIKKVLTGLAENQGINLTIYFSAIIFVLLEYVQASVSIITWQRLLARLFYILIAFGAYLYFIAGVEEKRFVPREEKVVSRKMLRISFFMKLLFLFVLLALVPITISSLLMFTSFKEIIDLYIYKPLLWNLKSSREAFLMALNYVQIQALFLMFLTGLLVFVSSVLVSRAIASSLRNISTGMERVSKGDFSFKLLADSNDEVGDVINYFNDMSEEIKNSREIMERWNHELEIKVAERTEDLHTLYNVSKAIGSSLDLELLISRAIDQLLPIMKADFYVVLVPDEKNKLVPRISRGLELQAVENSGLLGEALKKNEIVFSENMIVSPLRAKGKTMAILVMGTKGPHTYSKEREINLLATISDQLAIAIENVGIYEKEKEAVARLTELDRLKNEFISMVSHELRTPITSVDGYISLFLSGAAGPVTEDQKNYLTIVKENDQRLLTLINRLLDFSRIETGRFSIKRELISMQEIIREAVESMKPQLEKKKAKIKLNLTARHANFMGDREKMGEVFINLIENALKFGKEEEAPAIEISTKDAEDFIQVEVADNGIGVDKEYLEKIFNKFYQIEDTMTRNVGGVGLGLAIVKEIIGNHHGKIRAESEGKGKGSKFIFNIPVAEKI